MVNSDGNSLQLFINLPNLNKQSALLKWGAKKTRHHRERDFHEEQKFEGNIYMKAMLTA